jgi:hypothetical protein
MSKKQQENKYQDDSKIYGYIERGMILSGGLSINQSRTIFLLALNDYFCKKIGLNLVSKISNDLLWGFDNLSTKIFIQDSNLGRALEAACDIPLYMEDKNFKEVKRLKQIIIDYWNINKDFFLSSFKEKE